MNLCDPPKPVKPQLSWDEVSRSLDERGIKYFWLSDEWLDDQKLNALSAHDQLQQLMGALYGRQNLCTPYIRFDDPECAP